MTDTAAYSDIRSVTAQQGTYEWYSPAWLVEAATAALGGIELDPATTAAANQLIGAERIYTIDDDGLAQQWLARSVFVGPPFNLRHLFAEKLVAEYQAGHVASAIIRTVAAFDEDWAQRLTDVSSVVCLPAGLVTYVDGTTGEPSPIPAPQAQAIWYLGSSPASFATEFRRFGVVVTPY